MKKKVPAYNGTLRDHTIMCPYCISECSGIRIFGKRIKSIAFSTDVAIIKNINADAIIAVYPFTPQAGHIISNQNPIPVIAERLTDPQRQRQGRAEKNRKNQINHTYL